LAMSSGIALVSACPVDSSAGSGFVSIARSGVVSDVGSGAASSVDYGAGFSTCSIRVTPDISGVSRCAASGG
jgi:hypothetical protein